MHIWNSQVPISHTKKVPMPYCAKENIDNIIFTCCVLHNILIQHDGNGWTEVDDVSSINLPVSDNLNRDAVRAVVTDFRI